MLLGFKRRFAPYVLDGSKTHTIRATRKIPPKVGEICHCYVDPRQKTMKLLGRWPCVKVESIMIYECGDGTFGVVVNGEELAQDEKNRLAWADGFRGSKRHAWAEMMAFWMTTHGNHKRTGPFVFGGDIIHWRWAEPKRIGDGGTAARNLR